MKTFITGSQFLYNKADKGGCLYGMNTTETFIENSVFSYNEANYGAVFYFVMSAGANILSSEFSHNRGNLYGSIGMMVTELVRRFNIDTRQLHHGMYFQIQLVSYGRDSSPIW